VALLVQYEKQLNAAQLEAVKSVDSPLLVLAGAGSGKTRVITYKVAYLINECGINPQNILAVTFTNKASNEMKERVVQLLGRDVDVWVRTFHSTAARILRLLSDWFGVPQNFTIIDQKDQLYMVKKIIKEMLLDIETYSPEKYTYLIERAKDRLLSPDEAEQENFSTDPVFYDIYRVYQDKLNAERMLDFGDLIYRLVRGLEQNPETLNKLKTWFRYLLVDEFQDTNYAQYILIKLLTLEEGNVCVVGDDDQSIYGFRGARVENVLNFTEDYPDVKVVKLEENYRSLGRILSASSSLINKNTGRLGKTLYTRKEQGDKIKVTGLMSDYGEAHYIAGEIKNLVQTEGYRYSDIAIFYRTNAQSRVFESIFRQKGIPYRLVGSVRFYDREEVKDVLAYLRLLVNPLDEVSLKRIAARPPRGIGEKTINSLISTTITRGIAFYHPESLNSLEGTRKKRVEEFTGMFGSLISQVENFSPPLFLKLLYDTTGYFRWLKEEGKEEKVRNLEELYNAVEEFSKLNPDSSIFDFLEEASLYQGIEEGDLTGDRVMLITLHNAKGLEFPVVFMAGMEEGVFPHYLSTDESANLHEERRLCYVGMTRAKEKLYMTFARKRKMFGRTIESTVSRFIMEIPEELILFQEQSDGFYDAPTFYGRRERAFGTSGSRNYKSEYHTSVKTSIKNRKIDWITENIRVVHKNFGTGKVLKREGEVAIIEFDDGKRMRFMLEFTPLEKEQ